jgi:hypothetical protein
VFDKNARERRREAGIVKLLATELELVEDRELWNMKNFV